MVGPPPPLREGDVFVLPKQTDDGIR
jgi:hypothetical protein